MCGQLIQNDYGIEKELSLQSCEGKLEKTGKFGQKTRHVA